jgi:hypothetical protein
MKILPNLFAIAWALLALGGLYLSLNPPGTLDPAGRAAARIEIFAGFEIAALLVALAAAGMSLARGDEWGGRRWWIGWTPVFGSIVIGGFVALAVLVYRAL